MEFELLHSLPQQPLRPSAGTTHLLVRRGIGEKSAAHQSPPGRGVSLGHWKPPNDPSLILIPSRGNTTTDPCEALVLPELP